MSLIKDIYESEGQYGFPYNLLDGWLSPKVWYRHLKWRRQRANRGWSDADAWDLGHNFSYIMADALRELQKNGVADYKAMFKNEDGLGFVNGEKYKSFDEVADDMEAYYKFSQTHTWADGLTTDHHEVFKRNEDGTVEWNPTWTNEETGKIITEKEIRKRMKNYNLEENKQYKRTQKAWHFIAENIGALWD